MRRERRTVVQVPRPYLEREPSLTCCTGQTEEHLPLPPTRLCLNRHWRQTGRRAGCSRCIPSGYMAQRHLKSACPVVIAGGVQSRCNSTATRLGTKSCVVPFFIAVPAAGPCASPGI
ncbi:hypothetical protein TRVL_04085 [Trypanosoma vivax]|nr:hypothetical protein TRVL_04085 [Trypanosoma vivax]